MELIHGGISIKGARRKSQDCTIQKAASKVVGHIQPATQKSFEMTV